MKAEATALAEKVKSAENGKMNRQAAGLNKAVLERKIELARERTINVVNLAFEKAIAHRENPSKYPLPTSNRSVERAFHNFLEVVPKAKRNKIIDKVNETLKASATTRSSKYKDIVNVDFRSKTAIAEQVKALSVPEELRFNEAEGNELLARFHQRADKKALKKREGKFAAGEGAARQSQPQQAAVATKVSFVVDTMTCLNPDDLMKDEINLAGFSIDVNGNNVELAPRFVGQFKKNDTLGLGANGTLFTLDIDPLLASQSFTAGLFIVESDLVSDPEVIRKLGLLFAAIGVAIAVVAVALMVVSVFVAPVISVAMAYFLVSLSFAFQVFSLQLIPLFGDDISLPITDTLLVEEKIDVGESFARNLQIGKGFDPQSTFDGKYTLAARWVGEA